MRAVFAHLRDELMRACQAAQAAVVSRDLLASHRQGSRLVAFVAGNSIIVAWFVASQANTKSDALLERAASEEVHVPFIWRAEIAATLLALSHNHRLQPARTRDSR